MTENVSDVSRFGDFFGLSFCGIVPGLNRFRQKDFYRNLFQYFQHQCVDGGYIVVDGETHGEPSGGAVHPPVDFLCLGVLGDRVVDHWSLPFGGVLIGNFPSEGVGIDGTVHPAVIICISNHIVANVVVGGVGTPEVVYRATGIGDNSPPIVIIHLLR